MSEPGTVAIHGGPFDGMEHGEKYFGGGTISYMSPAKHFISKHRDKISDQAIDEANAYIEAGGTHMFHGYVCFKYREEVPGSGEYYYTGKARFVGSNIESPLIAQAWEPAHA